MLPIAPPVSPMLAKLARALPPAGRWLYEPKWDGFRVLVFRDGDDLFLQSRDGRPLLRYFPEVEAPLKEALPARCVVDGELIVVVGDRLSFDDLQLRLHPAASRIAKLSVEGPARVVLFDLLALGDDVWLQRPFEARRAALTDAIRPVAGVHVTPATAEYAVAADWFERFEGAGLDGVIVKPLDGTYEPGRRTLVKVKHERTADCVVAGFRWAKDAAEREVGSLVLGLFDDRGRLQQVGVASGFRAALRRELAVALEPLRPDALKDHPWADEAAVDDRRPGGNSRWARDRSLAWEPVRLERVAEVAYTQLTNGRFRHPARLVRFRPDRVPADCRYDQLEEIAPAELAALVGGESPATSA